MTDYSVHTGTFSFSNTLGVATADAVSWPDYRANYLTVANTGASVIYARADGQTATVAGEGCVAIPPGDYSVLANGLPLWYPSSAVLVPGDDNANAESKAGGTTTTGTTVSLIASASAGYSISII